MFKILLASLTNRQYNMLDLMVFMLFAGFIVTGQLWTAFFVITIGAEECYFVTLTRKFNSINNLEYMLCSRSSSHHSPTANTTLWT